MPSSPDPLTAFNQALLFSAKLTEALIMADDFGGLARLRSKVRPATAAKLTEGLRLLRAEIDEQLTGLDKPLPPRRTMLLRRQDNKHVPF